MSVSGVFSIVLFIILLSVLSLGLINTQLTTGITNQSNTNLTIITTGSGIQQVSICNYHSDIPIFGGIIWGADCIVDFASYIYSLFTINTGTAWLGAIIVACLIALAYMVARLFRGG